MNSLQLLKVLIQELERYEEQSADKNDLTLNDFVASISPKADLEQLKNNFVHQASIHSPSTEDIQINIERVIAQHVLFLYRYIKLYSKLVFSDTSIKTIEEFGFLITLLQVHSLPKSELIRRNIYEKSSGVEIINRLIKSGHLTQKANPEDKRSQLVSLTDVGRSSLYQVFDKMNNLGIIAAGNLQDHEKYQLAELLKKLDDFHFLNYYDTKSDDLTDYLPDHDEH